MRQRRPFILLPALLLLALPSTLLAQVEEHPVTSDSTASLSQGANVRMMAIGLSSGWMAGTVGLADEGCTIVLVDYLMSPSGKLGVFLGAAAAIQVEFEDTDGTIKWRPLAIKTAIASENESCGRRPA